MSSDPLLPAQWSVHVPKWQPWMEEAEISLWILPRENDAAPLASISVSQAGILWSEDPQAPGFALFVKLGEIEQALLFSWNETNLCFVPAFPLSWLEAFLPSPEPPPLPDMPDFGDPAVKEMLEALYRVAAYGSKEEYRAFIKIFLELPQEAQDWVASFVVQTLGLPESPFHEIAQYAANAYQEYLVYLAGLAQEQASAPSQGPVFFLVEAPASESGSRHKQGPESGNSKNKEDWSLDLAKSAKERRTDSADSSISSSLHALGAARRLALARQRDDSHREGREGTTPGSGSRIGIQEIAGERARAAREKEERAGRNRFLERFFSMTTEPQPLAPSDCENPPDREGRDSLEKQFALELRRRLRIAARRS